MDLLLSISLLGLSGLFMLYFFLIFEEHQKLTFVEAMDRAGFQANTKKEAHHIYKILKRNLNIDYLKIELNKRGFRDWKDDNWMFSCKGRSGSLYCIPLKKKVYSCVYRPFQGQSVHLVKARLFDGKLLR